MANQTHPIIDYSRMEFLSPEASRIFRKRMGRISDFHQLRTLHKGDDHANYGKQLKRYFFDESVESVWQTYHHALLHEMWPGPKVQYLFAFSKVYDRTYYALEDTDLRIHVGLQVFCLLNLAGPVGIVGMEVLDINPENHTLELAYLEGGFYRGFQRLELVEQVQGGTQVIHHSFYKSESWLGKIIPYKYFHQKTSDEFHNNFQTLILTQKRHEKTKQK